MLEIPINSQSIIKLNEELKKAKASLTDLDGVKLKALEKVVKGLEKDLEVATNGVDDFKDALDDTNKSLKTTGDEVGDLGKDSVTTVKSINSLEDSLSKLNEELGKAEIGSEAYRALEKQVIGVSSELKNLELSREALDNEQFASEAKSVAGGLGDVAGGLTLIGASNSGVEKVVQTMAQVDGITRAVTGAVEAYSSGVKVINALTTKGNILQNISLALGKKDVAGKAAQTAATGAQTVATGTAETATIALNTAMLANPIFLVIAALAALVAALVWFGSSTEVAEEQNNELNKSLEKQNNLLDRNNEKLVRGAKNRVDLLKSQGATTKEVYEAEIALIEAEEEARVNSRKLAYQTIQEKKKVYKQALAEENEELAKTIGEEIRATRQKYKQLKDLDGQYLIDKEIKTNEYNTRIAEEQAKQDEQDEADRKDAADRAKSAREKRLEEIKKYNDDRLEAARKITDLELSLMEDGINKTIAIQEEGNKRELEDLKSKYGDLTKLNEEQLNEYNTTRELLIKRGEDRISEIKEEENLKQLTLEKELADKLYELNNANRVVDEEFLKEQYDRQLNDLTFKLENELITIEEYNNLKLIASEKYRIDAENIQKDYDEREKAAQIALLNSGGYEDKLKALEEERRIALEDKTLTESELALIEDEFRLRREELDLAEKERKINDANEIAGAISQGLNFISDISNTNFENEQQQRDQRHEAELSNLEEGSDEYEAAKARQVKEDEDAAKKKFEIDKKLQIAQAVVQGVQAVLAAYSSGSAIPVVGAVTGPLFAGLAAVATIANINKIKNSKYTSSSASPTTGGGGADISSTVQAATPDIGLFGQGNDENTVGPGANQGGDNNQNVNVTATVSVSEITETQNKVSVQEERASL